MKIVEALIFTDNEVARVITDKGNYYLSKKNKKVYDMHPINVMAEEVDQTVAKEVKATLKKVKYNGHQEIKEWL